MQIHKYFIESLIINDNDNPETWSEADWLAHTKGHAVIGYLFSTKGVKFGSYGKALTLYLINKKYCRQSEINLAELYLAYFNFENKCHLYPNEKDYAKRMVFKNPPIEEWLATKDNWITKNAKQLSESWSISYDEALSSIYFIVAKLYHRGDVYMGNLRYIYLAVLNKLRMKERYDKNRLYGKNVISGDSARYTDKDGNIETWFETIGKEDEYHKEHDYLDFVNDLKTFMSKDFSPREIDQIFSGRPVGCLPQGLYRRLLRWREKHPLKEVHKLI